jgi:colicin import membrane protein
MATVIENSGTAIVAAEAPTSVVLFDNEKFDAFLAKLKADVAAVPVDLTTKKGRDAIASVAAKVRSEKASIDKDRLRLTAEWRNMTAQVNGAWNNIKEQMDALAVEARKPLTEWEQAEKDRNERADAIINQLARDAMVSLDDSAADVRARGMSVYETALDPALFGDKLDTAQQAKDHAISQLKAALDRLTREEAERAELEKLRAEAAERAEAERIAAELAEAERAEAARIEAERVAVEKAKAEAEQRRIAAEQAESARIERAKVEAAKAEQDKRDAEHARQLAEAQAERDRIAAQEAERQRLDEQARAEQARRDADQKHRTAVMRAAKEAIMTCGADEETARKIVMLIRAGDVPNVTLRF